MELLTWHLRGLFSPRPRGGMRGGDLIREVFGSDSDSDDADELNHPAVPALAADATRMRRGDPAGADACVGMFVARRRWVKTRGGGSWTAYAPTTSWISQTMNHRRRRPIGAHPFGGARNQAMRFGRDHLPRWRSRSPTPSPSSRREDPATPTANTTSRRGPHGRRRRRRRRLPTRGAGPRAHGIRRLQPDDRQPVRAGRGLTPHVDLTVRRRRRGGFAAFDGRDGYVPRDSNPGRPTSPPTRPRCRCG